MSVVGKGDVGVVRKIASRKRPRSSPAEQRKGEEGSRACAPEPASARPEQARPSEESSSLPAGDDLAELSNRNPHHRDSCVRFEEASHQYFVDWCLLGEFSKREALEGAGPSLRAILDLRASNPEARFAESRIVSVSAFYKPYWPGFDADKVISKMRNSVRWPKSKYYGMEPADIKAQWAATCKAACDFGHDVHEAFEHHFNGQGAKIPAFVAEHAAAPARDLDRRKCKVYQQFLRFLEDTPLLRPYRTEMVLVSDGAHMVCGTPDLVALTPGWASYNNSFESFHGTREFQDAARGGGVTSMVQKQPPIASGSLHLTVYDWKTCKEIKTKNFFEKGHPPFDQYPNSNYWHYTVQLNTYAYLLEKYYKFVVVDGVCYRDVVVDKMMLVCVNPGFEKGYKLFDMPRVQDKVEFMFKKRREQLLEATAKDEPVS